MTFAADPERRFDRHLGLASELAGKSRSEVIRKFVDQRLLLTGDPERLATPAGRLMLLVTANLIARFCPKIDLQLDPSERMLVDETLGLLHRIDSSRHAEFRMVARPALSTYAGALAIGAPTTGMPVDVVIDAAGWLAAISTIGALPPLPRTADGNPFGALIAAALGAAEIFKHLVKPRPGKAFPFGTATFSAYDYSVDSLDPGPTLHPATVLPPTLLAGVGAVGNAFLLALSNVPNVCGDLYPVDKEQVDDPSNLNRYSLAEERDADPEHPMPKTHLAVRLFEGTGLDVHPLQVPLDTALKRVHNGELPRPTIVASAVDNNAARDDLQKLWPDVLLEGATDHTLAQVSRHEHGSGLACLLCIHSRPSNANEFSYVSHAAEISGLSQAVIAASLRDAEMVVTDAHIEGAPDAMRTHLAAHVGKPICSVVGELERLSAKPAAELPHQPTVSFVSMMSGVLMAAELVKYVGGLGSGLLTFFQIDTMFPLQNAGLQTVEAVSNCYCITRSDAIRQYRAVVQSSVK
ncbi:MAG: hypothetical protein LAO77_26125 [Acidobacteriia bacterium]|nr:hypothetical protein [Terriglobia bacterium]